MSALRVMNAGMLLVAELFNIVYFVALMDDHGGVIDTHRPIYVARASVAAAARDI